MRTKNPIALLIGWLALNLAPTDSGRAADDRLPGATTHQTASITGQVSNAATGNMLEGASVGIPTLGLAALTDVTGRFLLAGVPPGSHEVVVAYIGLEPARRQVSVTAGQRANQDFDLTTTIYKMDQFKVGGEREGGAAAITLQRNAPNLTHIASMDSFGNLPNTAASEAAIRIPGVAGALNDEGNVIGFSVRGMDPALNTITVDGALLSSQGGMNRTTRIFFTGSMFEQVEVIKGHTPDKGADSLGGTVNLKSRSPLSMKEKRRITYNVTGRLAPSFTEQIPLREDHRLHPLLNLGYQEVFGVFGAERNLGVAVNLFYSENAVGFFRTTRDFQDTTTTPAYVWDYRTMDNYNNRKQISGNVKVDYRYSPITKVSFNGIYNDGIEKYRRRYETRAFTTQSVGTTGNAGILPGYTDRITTVRAAPGSTIDVTMTGPNVSPNLLRHVDLGAEHELPRLWLDYNAAYSKTLLTISNGKAGTLINRITNVGWVLDRTASDLYPRFIQTEGADFTNPANYRPAPNGLSNADNENNHTVKVLKGNARYELRTPTPIFFKTGFQWREQTADNIGRSRRWNHIGTTALPADPSIELFDTLKTGRQIPQWESHAFMHEGVPSDPSIWREDQYFREQQKYINTLSVTETVTAGYAMVQGKLGSSGIFGRTGYLTGVRTERTDTESWGWVRARSGSTAAQQAADPIGSAERDYANTRREIEGSYTKSFPSAHLTHDFTSKLKARLSWSTSFGRPSMTNAQPNETVSEANQTLTINNPALLPQTAANWDASLDYSFEPVGNLSVGWFHKTIKDYIIRGINAGTVPTGPDNGYSGEYAGFTTLTSSNGGTAVVQGWEFSYQQQFTSLPGILKGLGASANYTVIDTHGDFGGTVTRTNGQVAGFIPKTGNLSLSWRYRDFSTQVLVNYTGEYISSFSAANLGRNLYTMKRTILNVGLAYQVRPAVRFTFDIANLTNEPQAFYRGIRDQIQSVIIPGVAITFGVSGRF